MLDAHVVCKSVFQVCCNGGFLGFWLIAVHHAGLHGVHGKIDAGLRNGFEGLVVKINNAVAAFNDKFPRLLWCFHAAPFGRFLRPDDFECIELERGHLIKW